MGQEKNVILYILALALIVGTTAITWSNKLPKKPTEFANKTGCYIREVNDVIPFNEFINALGYCYLIHCTLKKIDYISCGVTSLEHEKMQCYITEAQSDAPFPRCCPMVKCYEPDIRWDTNGTSKNDPSDERRRLIISREFV